MWYFHILYIQQYLSTSLNFQIFPRTLLGNFDLIISPEKVVEQFFRLWIVSWLTFCTGPCHFAINWIEGVKHRVVLVPEHINCFLLPIIGIKEIIGK